MFREWLHDSSTALPRLRDALHARLGHVRRAADLEALIEAIRKQEAMCLAEYGAAHARLKTAERTRRLHSPSASDLPEIVRRALMIDEIGLWGSHAARLKRLRECLDDQGAELDGEDA